MKVECPPQSFPANQLQTTGTALLDELISHLPVELQLLGYHYCGPGTNLFKRLSRGHKQVILLNKNCKQHILYSNLNREVRQTNI